MQNQSEKIIAQLIERYNGKNRWFLEAIGTAATKKEAEVYNNLIRPLVKKTPHAQWTDKINNLVWRFHTAEAIDDLYGYINTQKPDIKEFRHLSMAFASYKTQPERLQNREI